MGDDEGKIEKVDAEIVPSGEAIEAQSRAEFDIQVATAQKYRRPALSKIKDRILSLATVDEETAADCFYRDIPRGGKKISGPGVRLAEIVASCYGNLCAGSRVISVDEETVTCQGVVWDLENNYRRSIDAVRGILNKNGRRYNADMIRLTCMAGQAIGFRDAVFAVVPMAVFKAEMDKIWEVAYGNEKTLEKRKADMIEFFGAKGVGEEKLLEKAGKRAVSDLDLEDVATLRGLATAINDGELSVKEAFGDQKPADDLKPGRQSFGGGAGTPSGEAPVGGPDGKAASDSSPPPADPPAEEPAGPNISLEGGDAVVHSPSGDLFGEGPAEPTLEVMGSQYTIAEAKKLRREWFEEMDAADGRSKEGKHAKEMYDVFSLAIREFEAVE